MYISTNSQISAKATKKTQIRRKMKKRKKRKVFALNWSVMNACAVQDSANGMLLQVTFTLHFCRKEVFTISVNDKQVLTISLYYCYA